MAIRPPEQAEAVAGEAAGGQGQKQGLEGRAEMLGVVVFQRRQYLG